MKRQQVVTLAIALLCGLASPVRSVSSADPTEVAFGRDVRPILADKCYPCHGPDEAAREADLRLDDLAEARYVLEPDGELPSQLGQRISASDERQMPPASANLPLTDEERTILQQWLAAGAEYQSHWSFVSPVRGTLPPVADVSWIRNPIDRYILARLEAEELAPAPLASKERIIRRVTFDLTGLPPTLEEIDNFLSDNSDDAYRQLVDRLLASEAFGERMASDWLDVARYSDTYGYQVDRDRRVWPWRDWVIQAFNSNMPYDQFVTWQLAGDLLPDATDEQILATTFNRLHPQKVEGGSVPEEFRVEYVADRNHTFGTALLGLTLECARCHDHKFDPISQKEYYQLFAFFNNIDEAGLYSYFTPSVPTPTLDLANRQQKSQLQKLTQSVELAESHLVKTKRRETAAFDEWLLTSHGSPVSPKPIEYLDFEESAEYASGGNRIVSGPKGNALRLSGDDGVVLKTGNFRRTEPFTVSLLMKTPDFKSRAVVFHRSRAWTDAGSRGYQLLIEEGKLSASLIHFWPGNAIRIRTEDDFPIGSWHQVTVTYDGSGRAGGLRIYVDGLQAKSLPVRDNLTRQIVGGGGDQITIGERSRDRGFRGGEVDDFRVFDRVLSRIEVAQLQDATRFEAARQPTADLPPQAREALREYYFTTINDETQTARAKLTATREALAEFVDGLEEIMVMRELAIPRTSHVLLRGAYDAPGEVVQPATPEVFMSHSDHLPKNRLGLSQWLTDPRHPLTARVAVNRLWQICFGSGLVRTTEDFGSQGDVPSHPQLLDWLALELVDTGWDLKQVLRTIVTSATYRQDSNAPAAGFQVDPENRLLGRAPRYRMRAESIRDNLLAVSGLLVRRVGGPSVKPYEVAVSFKPVDADEGDGLYRRSLYTYWKRTAPAPVMMALDAAKRDVCATRRERTKSPLQALVLLNDPQSAEAARTIGRELSAKHGSNQDLMLEELFRRLTSRRPDPAESSIVRQMYREQLVHFQSHLEDAYAFLDLEFPAAADPTVARIAAAGTTASALMNHEDCVTRR